MFEPESEDLLRIEKDEKELELALVIKKLERIEIEKKRKSRLDADQLARDESKRNTRALAHNTHAVTFSTILTTLLLVLGVYGVVRGNSRPTPLPTATSSPTSRDVLVPEDPARAIEWYYRELEVGNYDGAWPFLTDGFRIRIGDFGQPLSYDQYTDFWKDFSRINIRYVEVVRESPEQSVVLVDLVYQYTTKDEWLPDQNQCIVLVMTLSGWKIEKKYTDAFRQCRE